MWDEVGWDEVVWDEVGWDQTWKKLQAVQAALVDFLSKILLFSQYFKSKILHFDQRLRKKSCRWKIGDG